MYLYTAILLAYIPIVHCISPRQYLQLTVVITTPSQVSGNKPQIPVPKIVEFALGETGYRIGNLGPKFEIGNQAFTGECYIINLDDLGKMLNVTFPLVAGVNVEVTNTTLSDTSMQPPQKQKNKKRKRGSQQPEPDPAPTVLGKGGVYWDAYTVPAEGLTATVYGNIDLVADGLEAGGFFSLFTVVKIKETVLAGPEANTEWRKKLNPCLLLAFQVSAQ